MAVMQVENLSIHPGYQSSTDENTEIVSPYPQKKQWCELTREQPHVFTAPIVKRMYRLESQGSMKTGNLVSYFLFGRCCLYSFSMYRLIESSKTLGKTSRLGLLELSRIQHLDEEAFQAASTVII